MGTKIGKETRRESGMVAPGGEVGVRGAVFPESGQLVAVASKPRRAETVTRIARS